MGAPAAGDADEWERARAGDGEAAGVLFDRHSARVFRHAMLLLQHRHDAEDATAAAFLELWRNRSKVRLVDGSVLPWLLVTTTHTCRNLARSTRRYGSLIAALPRGDESPSADQTLATESSDLLEHVDPELASAIRLLPANSASLLALTAMEGMSTAEAAEAMGMSPAAARKRLSRARSQVRTYLDKHLPVDDLREVRHG